MSGGKPLKLNKQEYAQAKLGELKPHPRNPRQGDVGAIYQSIEANGFYGAIVAQRSTGYILAGNHRYKAAVEAGAKSVPVIWVDVDDETAVRVLLADNRTNDVASYDNAVLAEILTELANGPGLEGTGYDGDDLDQIIGDLAGDEPKQIVEDEASDPPADPVTKPGDLWLLGEHRVLCGDSTKPEDVARLMAGEVAEMMVTDPPYGVEYDPSWRADVNNDGPDSNRATGKVANDHRADWAEAWELFGGDVAYVWHADIFSPTVARSLETVNFELRYLVIWAKQRHTFGRGHYHRQLEPCWFAVRKNGRSLWCGDRTQTNLWQIDNNRSNETGHGTQKPIECMAKPMLNHSAALVYDPFLGSGTTLIAAEQLGRKCYGMEISPAYCDVIVQRWENLTGKKAVLADE